MTDADFLPSILADPDDDGPRLVYADWLDERPDNESRLRAEFIRLQVELAAVEAMLDRAMATTAPLTNGLPYAQRRHALRRRERELLGEHLCEWVWQPADARMVCHLSGDAPGEVNVGLYRPMQMDHRQTFRRGFVEAVSCTADAWLAHGDALLAAQPVRGVVLTTWPDPTHLLSLLMRRRGPEADRAIDALATGPGTATRYALGVLWGGIDFTLPPAAFDAPDPAPIPSPPYPRRPVNRPRRRR